MAKSKGDMYVGSIHETNNYGNLEVIHYTDCENVFVRFVETGYETKAQASQIRAGFVKDLLLPSVHGVGFIGIGKFNGDLNKNHHLAYKKWIGMLERGYRKGRI